MPFKIPFFLCSLFCFISVATFAQKTVTGKVVNSVDNQPIAGASVQVKGSTIGTQTNEQGEFSIDVPSENSILVFSVIGYSLVEMPVAGQTNLSVSMVATSSELSEVVVTGYSTQLKKDITGSVAVVNVGDLKTVPTASPEQMLQGRASGVNIITSGEPGSASNIRIRGITSFGNSDPLVIIDGVQASLRDINADDIESMQILKDAGAASIYGVRGSNGVIVITTKRGKSGKTRITYDGYYGTQRPLDGNVFHLLNTPEMAQLTWDALKNSNQVDPVTGNPSHFQYGNGATPVIPDYILIGGQSGVIGEPTPEQIAQYNVDYSKGPIYQIVPANKQGTDYFHEIFDDAHTQKHTLTASGGAEKSNYLFAIGYYDQNGTLKSTYYKRYSARINTTFTIKNTIRVGENLYVFYKERPQSSYTNQSEGNAISMSYRQQPIIPVYDMFGGYAGTAAKGLGNAQNPVAILERAQDNRSRNWDIIGNVFAELDFLKHFTARTSFGGTMDNGYYYYYTYHTYENAENNGSNAFSENSYYNRSWTWTNTLAYNNVFAEKHSLKVLVGLEAIENYGRGVGGSSLNYFLDFPDYWTLSNGSSGFTNYSNVYKDALYSQFGRVDYTFSDRYLFSATVRHDGSSRFSEDQRWGWFPSFSGGWRISNEAFFKEVTWVNDLKIRGSWGKLGNQLNVNPFNSFPVIYNGTPSNAYYPIAGTSNSATQGIITTRIGNVNTSWEEDKIWNIGLDAALWKSKFEFSAEYYKKSVSGLLFTDQVPAVVGGATLPTVNIGDIENKGFDFTLTYHGGVGKEFQYDVSANLTTYQSDVTKIPGDYFTAGGSRIGDFVRNEVGHPVGSFFGYEVIGLFQNAEDVAKSPTQTAAAPGRFKYKDVNGDGAITPDDRTFFGNPNPDFTYGLNLGARYKGFDFSMFLYGSQGNDVINYVRYWTDFFPSFQGVKSQDLLYNSWTPDRTNAKTPINENESNFSNNGVVNSYYKENGSYLRCKSIILGYTLPAKFLSKYKIDRLRIYIQAANLFTITDYTGLDPELSGTNSYFGIDYGNYPNNQKNYNIGINLAF